MVEGVYRDTNLNVKSTPLTTFIAKGVKPSLSKICFGLFDDEKRCWAGMFTLFDDMLQEGRFSEYVIDKNGTLFVDAEHPWWVKDTTTWLI
jgi:hypothetical protein